MRSDESSFRLIPFRQEAAAKILAWVGSREELGHWCGRTDYPLLDPSVFHSWHNDPEVAAFLLEDGRALVGYGEVWSDHSEQEIELARIIVAPEMRGLGIGRLLTQRLVQFAEACELGPIWLRVAPSHQRALRCYRKLRFVRASEEREARFNAPQAVAYVWLRWRAAGVGVQPPMEPS